MAHRAIYDGARYKVIALELADRTCPSEEFLNDLSAKDRAKVAAIIQRLGDVGEVSNKEKFKKIEDTNLFEIKSFQIRIFCFFSPDRKLVLLYGLRKKQDKHKSSDLGRAEEYREFYVRQLEGKR